MSAGGLELRCSLTSGGTRITPRAYRVTIGMISHITSLLGRYPGVRCYRVGIVSVPGTSNITNNQSSVIMSGLIHHHCLDRCRAPTRDKYMRIGVHHVSAYPRDVRE